jgi:hypothetical protein
LLPSSVPEPIERLIERQEFRDLSKRLSEDTVFDILGVSLDERTHSRMLAWLLDPSESHGLGTAIVRRFLYEAAKLARQKALDFELPGRLITPLLAETLSFADLVIQPEYSLPSARRPDLVLSSEREGWLCLIENKIGSGEGEEQTSDYYSGAVESFPPGNFPHRLFVYLSPRGLRPQSKYFVPMSYSSLLEILVRESSAASVRGQTTISQYVKCLRSRVVEQKELQEICWKLYRTHATAVDTIVQYGKVNLLAARTAERVLELLGDPGQPPLADRQVKWRQDSGTGWIGTWPGHWRTGRRYGWPAYFAIVADSPGAGAGGVTTERIRVGIWFDSPNGPGVRDIFRRLALEGGATEEAVAGMLRPEPFESRSLEDLPAAVEKAACRILELIRDSFGPLGGALGQPD